MKRFLWVLAVLALAVMLGVLLINLPGYVLVQIHHSSIAMPLWLAAVGLFLVFVLVFVLQRLWSAIMTVPSYIKRLKHRRSMQHLQHALECLISGDWFKAESQFKKLANKQFLLPYTQLMAARAASLTGRVSAQEYYVKTARPILPQEALLIELAKLDLLSSQKNWQVLLSSVHKLKPQYPGNPGILRREIKALQELKAWPQIIELLAETKQLQVFAEAEYEALAIQAYVGHLSRALRLNPQTIEAIWQTIPSDYQQQPEIAAVYVTHLTKTGQFDLAEKYLQQAMEHQNVSAENLSAMAQICLACRHPSKARSYAEQSLSLKPTSSAYSIMAQIDEQEGNVDKALKTYKQALALL